MVFANVQVTISLRRNVENVIQANIGIGMNVLIVDFNALSAKVRLVSALSVKLLMNLQMVSVAAQQGLLTVEQLVLMKVLWLPVMTVSITMVVTLVLPVVTAAQLVKL